MRSGGRWSRGGEQRPAGLRTSLCALFPAELFGGAGGKGGHRFAELLEGSDRLGKRARADDRLAGIADLLERQAGTVVELQRHAQAIQMQGLADLPPIGVFEVFRGADAEAAEPGGKGRADAPDVLRAESGKQGFDVRQAPDIERARLGRGFFDQLKGDLGERFRRGDADRNGNAGLLEDGAADRSPIGFALLRRHTRQQGKRFVDGIDLQALR